MSRRTSGLIPDGGVIGRLPFEGEWLIEVSSTRRVPSHGTDLFGTTYAFDFLAVGDDGRSAPARSLRTVLATEPPTLFYAFGRLLYSPVAGTVVSVHDGEPDHEARCSILTLISYGVSQPAPEDSAGTDRGPWESRHHRGCRTPSLRWTRAPSARLCSGVAW